jgi:hypothetical protein
MRLRVLWEGQEPLPPEGIPIQEWVRMRVEAEGVIGQRRAL